MIQTTSTLQNVKYNKKLSIQFGLNGLSFCVLDTLNQKILALESMPFDKKCNPYEALERLMHYFDARMYLQDKFDEVLVMHENNLSTLVPNTIFNEAYLADYLKFNSKILQSDHLSFDGLEFENCKNVYVPYVNANNYIYDAFGSFTYKHFSTVLIETLLKKEQKNTNGSTLYIHLGYKHFEIVAVRNAKLQFYNTFEYNNVQDFAYYTLFTVEQLGYDTETIPVALIGKAIAEDEYYKILYKYIRHVSISKNQNSFNIDNTDTEYSNFTILNSF